MEAIKPLDLAKKAGDNPWVIFTESDVEVPDVLRQTLELDSTKILESVQALYDRVDMIMEVQRKLVVVCQAYVMWKFEHKPVHDNIDKAEKSWRTILDVVNTFQLVVNSLTALANMLLLGTVHEAVRMAQGNPALQVRFVN